MAGFDVYGSVSHQLESRLYMDFLRMEGELNFLLYLPPEDRAKLREYWYRDAPGFAKQHVFAESPVIKERESDLNFTSDHPKAEFLSMMQQRIHGATADEYDYRQDAPQDTIEALDALALNVGKHNSYMPQVSFLNVIGDDRDDVYSILRDSGYTNIALLFLEDYRRLPAEDELTIAKGFIGEHPNLFFQVHEKQLPLFAADVAAMNSKESWLKLRERYSVQRNEVWFWTISDKFHRRHLSADPLYHGLFDYNRYRGNK